MKRLWFSIELGKDIIVANLGNQQPHLLIIVQTIYENDYSGGL